MKLAALAPLLTLATSAAAQDGGTSGTISEGPGLVAHSAATFGALGTIAPGDTWRFQGGYRDPQGPCGGGFNLSSALAVTFVP